MPSNITKIHKFEHLGATETTPKSQSIFELNEGIWDLSSIKLLFEIETTATLPQCADSLIDSLSVSIDDVEVQSIKNYNHLARMMFMHNRPTIFSNIYGNDLPVGDLAPHGIQLYTIDKFHGILGTQDLVIQGRIQICITWADSNVLIRADENVSYTIRNPYIVVRSEILDNLSDIVDFDNFSSTFQRNEAENQETNIFISSRDIEYVIATFLDSTYSKSAALISNGTSKYFKHGLAAINKDIYVIFSVNNIPISNHPVNYKRAIEYLDTIYDNSKRSIDASTSLTKSGSVLTKSINTINTQQWVFGLPIDIFNDDRSYNITFHSNCSGGTSLANYSLIFVK